uniref:Uncharacterized protein n=1 Tax=Equus asinus TaxID=9793 RepID=A0A9L0IM42_EQUAS
MICFWRSGARAPASCLRRSYVNEGAGHGTRDADGQGKRESGRCPRRPVPEPSVRGGEERRGCRRELDSWRHRLMHCVGFESILEGLYGPRLRRDLSLFEGLSTIS